MLRHFHGSAWPSKLWLYMKNMAGKAEIKPEVS